MTQPRRVTGSGEPVTVFAHGLGETIADARVWGSGIEGTKVFVQFRGHGRTPAPPGPWSYDDLVAELHTAGALDDPRPPTRAVGVSLGAAVLIRLLATDPARFERVALLLPSVYTRGRPRRDGSEPTPSGTGRTYEQSSPGQADGAEAIGRAYDELLSHPVLDDPSVLKACTASVLVIGQEGDDVHPAALAHEVANAFPQARLEILPPGGILEAHRARTRSLMAEFLGSHGKVGQREGMPRTW